jgi:hypothetical protein
MAMIVNPQWGGVGPWLTYLLRKELIEMSLSSESVE